MCKIKCTIEADYERCQNVLLSVYVHRQINGLACVSEKGMTWIFYFIAWYNVNVVFCLQHRKDAAAT